MNNDAWVKVRNLLETPPYTLSSVVPGERRGKAYVRKTFEGIPRGTTSLEMRSGALAAYFTFHHENTRVTLTLTLDTLGFRVVDDATAATLKTFVDRVTAYHEELASLLGNTHTHTQGNPVNTYRVKTLLDKPPFPYRVTDKADLSCEEACDLFCKKDMRLALSDGASLEVEMTSVHKRDKHGIRLFFELTSFEVREVHVERLRSFVNKVLNFATEIQMAMDEPPFAPEEDHLKILTLLATTYHFTGLDTNKDNSILTGEGVTRLHELWHNGYVKYEPTGKNDGVYIITPWGMMAARNYYEESLSQQSPKETPKETP